MTGFLFNGGERQSSLTSCVFIVLRNECLLRSAPISTKTDQTGTITHLAGWLSCKTHVFYFVTDDRENLVYSVQSDLYLVTFFLFISELWS